MEILSPAFQGKKERAGCPSGSGCFSSTFNSKQLICQAVYLGVTGPEIIQYPPILVELEFLANFFNKIPVYCNSQANAQAGESEAGAYIAIPSLAK